MKMDNDTAVKIKRNTVTLRPGDAEMRRVLAEAEERGGLRETGWRVTTDRNELGERRRPQQAETGNPCGGLPARCAAVDWR